MSKIGALIELTRPANSIMVGCAVLIGAVVVDPNSLLGVVPLGGFLTGFFVSSYSMVVNDRYDVEVDRINAPQRP
ncbi:MAG: prenyltransferase, partial [Thaumarchaeota archaeon]|nr:prenyltransferase [Nitrososphaerota archaeon]